MTLVRYTGDVIVTTRGAQNCTENWASGSTTGARFWLRPGTMGIFIIFVLSRALHPMVIDYSKVDGKMLYSKNSPAIMSFPAFFLLREIKRKMF